MPIECFLGWGKDSSGDLHLDRVSVEEKRTKKLMDESWENKSKPWWHETCFPGGENRIIN